MPASLPPETSGAFDLREQSALFARPAGPGDRTAGTLAAWDPQGAGAVLAPGVKVFFFGAAPGCRTGPGLPAGPVGPGRRADIVPLLSRLGLAATARRWTPIGLTDACDAGSRTREGPNLVAWEAGPAGSAGRLGLYTEGGRHGRGEPLLRPWGAAGQNGAGANAGIVGTFVDFRQAWGAPGAVHPWGTGTRASAPEARIATVQSVHDLQAGANGPAKPTTQAKQQVTAAFINTACARQHVGPHRPCQIQYLFNTAISRSGVTDWRQVPWFQTGRVMFDPAQGGVPVVEGPVREAGRATLEAPAGARLFRSEGAATQHGTFTRQRFDVRISFEDLMNAVRLTVSAFDGVPGRRPSDASVAAMWGNAWNRPAAWALLSIHVGQEVYDPAGLPAWVAGDVEALEAGPAPRTATPVR